MKTKWKWILSAAGLVIAVLAIFGFLSPLNILLPQNPPLDCVYDYDCTLYVYPDWASCFQCRECKVYDIGDPKVMAIRRDWQPFCLLPAPAPLCTVCMSGISKNGEVLERPYYPESMKCIADKCQKVVQ